VPSQLATAFDGVVHGVHDVRPQLLGLLFDWQFPLQLCVPVPHVPWHACAAAMQTPAHSFVPLGQVPPHDTPSQVARPWPGTGQGMHEAPQVAGEVSSAPKQGTSEAPMRNQMKAWAEYMRG